MVHSDGGTLYHHKVSEADEGSRWGGLGPTQSRVKPKI